MTANRTYNLKAGQTVEHGPGYATVRINDNLSVDLVSVARNWDHLADADKTVYVQPESLAELTVGQLAWMYSMGTYRFGVIVKVAKTRVTVAYTTATSVQDSWKYGSDVRIFEKAAGLDYIRVAKVNVAESAESVRAAGEAEPEP